LKLGLYDRLQSAACFRHHKQSIEGEQNMAKKTLILAALIALGLGSAFVISTVSSVSVLAETSNGGN
jgi:hypothetical protein